MRKLGKKQLAIELTTPLQAIPPGLAGLNLSLSADGRQLIHDYEFGGNGGAIGPLLQKLEAEGIGFGDLSTRQTSLEDIFVSLIGEAK